jgi:hypothetical protein
MAPMVKFSLSLVALLLAIQSPQSVYLKDSSDWWSIVRKEEMPVPASHIESKVQNRVLDPSNFEVAGFKVSESLFEEMRGRTGNATIVLRGDGVSGREQICYLNNARNEYLIFEKGELELNFYLIKKGQDWKGSEHCLHSEKLSALATKSGLRIGATVAEVRKVLGTPSFATRRTLIYRFETKVKKSSEILEKFKSVSEGELPDEWDYSAQVEADFEHGKLTSLGISKMKFLW